MRLDAILFGILVVVLVAVLRNPRRTWRAIRGWLYPPGETEPSTPPNPATYSPCDPEKQLDGYRQLLPEAKSIHVFRNGTAVVSPIGISSEDAVQIMREHGPAHPGSPSADFSVSPLTTPISGFLVEYNCPEIISFASDYPPDCPTWLAGSMIRMSREMDAIDLQIVAQHVSTPNS